MNPVAALKSPKTKISGNGSGRSPGSDGDGYSSGGGTRPLDRYPVKLIGLWLFLATVVMFFASITSALIVRRAAPDWKPIYFPPILWLNTAILLLSSLSMEISRRALRQSWDAHRTWLGLSAFLGVCFLGGQIYAWKELAAHGLFLPTSPHSSFFYVITGLHGLHLVGALIWLSVSYMTARTLIPVEEREKSLKLVSLFWHFLDLLWVYLFVLLLAI